jgi:hypothetical protein
LKSMPTEHLMYDSRRRQEASHKMGDVRVFSTHPKVWITKDIPTQLGGVVLLLTFAVLAPLLAMSIILFFLLDSYVSQLVLGRFLVTELGVVMEYKRCHDPTFYKGMNRSETAIYVSPNKLARIAKDIEDATKPWGAFAVLKEVNDQCRHMPASTISIGRTAFVITPSITMAFTVNDVLNNSRDEPQYWPSILLMCLAFTLEMLTIVFTRYTTAATNQISSNENSTQQSLEQNAEMKHNEHFQSAIELAQQKVTYPRGIDADRDSSIEDWGIEFRPAVSISMDGKEQQKKQDAISPMHVNLP